MQRWEVLIDKAAAACGGPTGLGRKLGISPQQTNDARRGRKRFTTAQVAAIAEIVGVPAAEVWLAQEDYRNPFRVIETAAIAVLSALSLFTLPSESQAAARLSEKSAVIDHAQATDARSIDRLAYVGWAKIRSCGSMQSACRRQSLLCGFRRPVRRSAMRWPHQGTCCTCPGRASADRACLRRS